MSHLSENRVMWDLSALVVIWLAAMVSVMAVPHMFGLALAYQAYPLQLSAYYLFWVGVLLYYFPYTTARIYTGNTLRSYAGLAFFLCGTFLLYAYVFPLLGAWRAEGLFSDAAGADFLVGGMGYVLVKLFEIALQQTLIAAIILILASRNASLAYISCMYMALFAVAHIFLIVPLGVVLTSIFVIASACSAIIFPYCILRCRNGFVLSYIIHWSFYLLLTLVLLLWA